MGLKKYVISVMDKPSYPKNAVCNFSQLNIYCKVESKNGYRNSHVHVIEGHYRVLGEPDPAVPRVV